MKNSKWQLKNWRRIHDLTETENGKEEVYELKQTVFNVLMDYIGIIKVNAIETCFSEWFTCTKLQARLV